MVMRPVNRYSLRLFLATVLLVTAVASAQAGIVNGNNDYYPLTARQWEMCAKEFGSATGNLLPCTVQDIEWGAERDGDSRAQVGHIVAVFTEESLSRAPKTMIPSPSVLRRLGMHSDAAAQGNASKPSGHGSSRSRTPGQASTGAGHQPRSRSSVPVTTTAGSAEPAAQQPSSTNANDSLVNNDVLSLTDPACGLRGMTVAQASRCLRTGDPSVPYPLGNYQMDIHMSTGLTHPINDVLTVLESVMNVIWMLLLYVLKGGLTLIGWAFSLSPFTNSSTLGSVQNKLESVYNGLDNAWIDAVFVAIGSYGMYLAFIRRRQAEAIGHLGASIAAIMLALAIIHAPSTFIGRPAGFVNRFAQDAISSANLAAHNQSGTVPASKLAALTGDLFDTFATGPFCALETNDVSWCMSPPSKLEMKAVQRAVQGDHSYEKQAKAIAADVATRLPTHQQSSAYQAIYKSLTSTDPLPRRADLFLRYPLGSTPRETLYALYTGQNLQGKSPLGEIIQSIISGDKSILKDASRADLLAVTGDLIGREIKTAWAIVKYGVHAVTSIYSDVFGSGSSNDGPKPLAPTKVAIQGSSGLVQRCLVLLLAVLALIGVLLVLIWLALHLVSQALLGFVLLFATPVMMLTPAFGASGRKAFGGWAKTLFGAIASKAFYAAFLGVFILALTALQEASTAALGSKVHLAAGALANATHLQASTPLDGEGVSGGGWGVPWVMQCLLCWAVFFKRNKIVAFFSIDPAAHQQSGSGSMTAMRMLGAAYAAHRLGGVAAGAAKRPINAYRTNALERRMGREDATRDLAFDELEAQELDVEKRRYDHDRQDVASTQNQLDRTGQLLDEMKQNPDYKKYVDWRQTRASAERLGQPHGNAGGSQELATPADNEEHARGEEIANSVERLEEVRRGLRDRHSQAQSRVNHVERNLHAHGQMLSPEEIQNRVEARRASLAQHGDDPDAWKRAENLALADSGGRFVTPEHVEDLEHRAPHDRAAAQELQNIRDRVTNRMNASERLLDGVPSRNRFDGDTSATSPSAAARHLRDTGKQSVLHERARSRRRELRHRRYRRKRLYRS